MQGRGRWEWGNCYLTEGGAIRESLLWQVTVAVVQWLSCVCDFWDPLWPHGLQHARLFGWSSRGLLFIEEVCDWWTCKQFLVEMLLSLKIITHILSPVYCLLLPPATSSWESLTTWNALLQLRGASVTGLLQFHIMTGPLGVYVPLPSKSSWWEV